MYGVGFKKPPLLCVTHSSNIQMAMKNQPQNSHLKSMIQKVRFTLQGIYCLAITRSYSWSNTSQSPNLKISVGTFVTVRLWYSYWTLWSFCRLLRGSDASHDHGVWKSRSTLEKHIHSKEVGPGWSRLVGWLVGWFVGWLCWLSVTKVLEQQLMDYYYSYRCFLPTYLPVILSC